MDNYNYSTHNWSYIIFCLCNLSSFILRIFIAPFGSILKRANTPKICSFFPNSIVCFLSPLLATRDSILLQMIQKLQLSFVWVHVSEADIVSIWNNILFLWNLIFLNIQFRLSLLWNWDKAGKVNSLRLLRINWVKNEMLRTSSRPVHIIVTVNRSLKPSQVIFSFYGKLLLVKIESQDDIDRA